MKTNTETSSIPGPFSQQGPQRDLASDAAALMDAASGVDSGTAFDAQAQTASASDNGSQATSDATSGANTRSKADAALDAALGPVAPAEVDFLPPLLRSLSSLLRLRGKAVSAQFLYSGLAGVQKVTPGVCLRAAEKAGLRGRILPRESLNNISPMTLPCVLLLRDNRSCVLMALREHEAEAIFPENGEEVQTVPRDVLVAEYLGYAIFGNVDRIPDKRIDSARPKAEKSWFWDAIRHYGPIYRHAGFASIVINLIGVASPLFVMNVYDRVVPNNAMDTLWVLAIGILIAYLFDFALRTLRSHFVDVAGRNADVVISSRLVDKVLTMRMDAKPESTGALVNNLREFESLREFFSSSTLLACIDLPFLFLFLLLLGFIGGPLVILPLIAMPIMFFAGILLQSMAKRAAERGYAQSMHKNALLTEIVNGLETLKCCMAENRMQRVWETVVEHSAQANIESKKYGSLAITFSTFITQFVTVLMVVWGVYRISSGDMTMGGLIGCNILAGRAMAPLMQMAGLLTRFQNSRISLNALNMLMDLPSEGKDSNSSVEFGPLSPSFTMENVSFAYPGADRLALDNVSLHIEQGEKVGIIGRMGSGKSTLGKLIIGLYQPRDGAVKFGGVDIRQIAGVDLRSRVGFAPQDSVLFYGTVRDNIVLGDPCISDQRMLRAATLSGVIDFIRSNPEGFGAQVGEQGKALSGGQRQAVALARALVRDPEVLILDEPTSNMDTGSELMVQKRLQEVMADKTLILVTHRLSMLSLVNRLVVMEGGRVVLDGPRDEVLQRLRGQPVQTKAVQEQSAQIRPPQAAQPAQQPAEAQPATEAVQKAEAVQPAEAQPVQKAEAAQPAVQKAEAVQPAVQKAEAVQPAAQPVQKSAEAQPTVQKAEAVQPVAQPVQKSTEAQPMHKAKATQPAKVTAAVPSPAEEEERAAKAAQLGSTQVHTQVDPVLNLPNPVRADGLPIPDFMQPEPQAASALADTVQGADQATAVSTDPAPAPLAAAASFTRPVVAPAVEAVAKPVAPSATPATTQRAQTAQRAQTDAPAEQAAQPRPSPPLTARGKLHVLPSSLEASQRAARPTAEAFAPQGKPIFKDVEVVGHEDPLSMTAMEEEVHEVEDLDSLHHDASHMYESQDPAVRLAMEVELEAAAVVAALRSQSTVMNNQKGRS